MAAFLLLSGLWGATWLFIKLGLGSLPPFTFAAARYLLSALILLPFVLFRRSSWPKSKTDWMLIVVGGTFRIAAIALLVYWGQQYIGSGLGSVLHATLPLFGLVFAHYLLPDDRITKRKVFGILVGLVGIALIYSGQLSFRGAMAAWGVTAVLASAAIAALVNTITKRCGTQMDPLTLTGGQVIVASILLSLAASTEGNPLAMQWTAQAIWSLIYLAVAGTALAFFLHYWLLQRIPVTRVQLQLFLSTILAVALGIVVFSETLTWQTALGMSTTILGVVVTLDLRFIPSPRAKKPIP